MTDSDNPHDPPFNWLAKKLSTKTIAGGPTIAEAAREYLKLDGEIELKPLKLRCYKCRKPLSLSFSLVWDDEKKRTRVMCGHCE